MQKLKRIIIVLLIIAIVAVIGFYFWGSSPNFNKEKYNAIIDYQLGNTQQSNDTLSILTFNIGYLSGNTNNLAVKRPKELFTNNLLQTTKYLKSTKPDFVCFQEIDFESARSFDVNQLNEIAVSNEYNYASMGVNWDKKYVPFPYGWFDIHFGHIYSGLAILSNYKITTNELIVLRKPENETFYYNAFYLDRVVQIDEVDVNGKKLIIMNIHLEAFDISTREKQAKTVLSIYRKYSAKYPVLLVGDFNSTPPNAVNPYEIEETMNTFLSEPNLQASISDSIYYSNESSYFTYSSDNPQIRIDYILYNSDKIEIVESRIAKEVGEVSDHLPVYARFVLK